MRLIVFFWIVILSTQLLIRKAQCDTSSDTSETTESTTTTTTTTTASSSDSDTSDTSSDTKINRLNRLIIRLRRSNIRQRKQIRALRLDINRLRRSLERSIGRIRRTIVVRRNVRGNRRDQRRGWINWQRFYKVSFASVGIETYLCLLKCLINFLLFSIQWTLHKIDNYNS